MCIICTKPKYVTMPSTNTLRRCWESNPQGAGYMYTDPSTRLVVGKKGFMKLDDFLKELSDPRFDKLNVVIHFRIATHGGVNPQATHPFPLSGKKDDLNALQWVDRCGVAHNGIIPNFGTQQGLSDTQDFIKKVLSKAGEHVLHPGVLRVAESMIGASRMVIMRRDRIVRLGTGWVNFKGCWYSNSGYKKQKYAQYGTATTCGKDITYSGWPTNRAWESMPNSYPAVQTKIGGYIKGADPVVPEPTGYRELPTATTYEKHPRWCDGKCTGCAYFEGGFCIIDEEMNL